MNNKEFPQGRQTLGIARAPLPVREKELAPPPTAEEIRDANAGKGLSKTENAILGFAKKHPFITVGSTLAAIAGGFAAVEAAQGNIPGIHREAQPSSFDNTAEKIIIGDNNILRLTSEEANRKGLLTPSVDLEKKTVTMPYPFVLPPGTTATIDKTPYKVRGAEYNDPRSTVPENTQSLFPEGTYVILTRGGANGGSDPNAIYNITTIYPQPNTGIFQQSQIEVDGQTSNIRTTNRSLSPDEFLALLKKYNWDTSKMIQDERVLKSDGKTPITTVVGGSQKVLIYDTTFQGPKTDYSGNVVEGMERKFTTDSGGKLIMLSPIQDLTSTK